MAMSAAHACCQGRRRTRPRLRLQARALGARQSPEFDEFKSICEEMIVYSPVNNIKSGGKSA